MSILILGAGAFAREVYDWCIQAGHLVVGFYVTSSTETTLRALPIFTSLDQLSTLDLSSTRWIIGTGNPAIMKILATSLKGAVEPSLPIIHPSCILGSNVIIGKGSVICPGSILTCDIAIGQSTIVNIGCTIGHDCVVGDYTHLSPNTSLSGFTTIGAECAIGTGVSTVPHVSIDSYSIVGAGASVTKNLPSGLHVGVPAITKRLFEEKI